MRPDGPAPARLVYGINPVREALRAKRARTVFLAEGVKAALVLSGEARQAGAQVEQRPREELDALAPGAPHQGAIALCGEYEYAELEDLLARAPRPALVLVLDGIQDPGNLGALVRSAHVLGAHGVVIPKDRSAEVTPAVVKTSAGATEHVPIAQVVNLSRALEQLKEAGLWVAGAVLGEDSQLPWEIDFTGPMALVIGSEGKGIRPLVERHCDFRIRIPVLGQVSSLSAPAAGAALLYEAARQRASAE